MTKQELPNLANATPSFLIDEMGKLRAEIKKLQQLEGYYKEGLKARWPEDETSLDGETYSCNKENVVQFRLNTEMIRADMDEDWIRDHSKTLSYSQFKIGLKE